MISRAAPFENIEARVRRLLSRYGAVTRPDLLLEFGKYDQNVVLEALDSLIEGKRVIVSTDSRGVPVYRLPPDDVNQFFFISSSTSSSS